MFQTATPAAVAHDFTGNMTKAAPDKDGNWTKGYSLKWDAWNRLVEVRKQHDDTPVASYQYDGLFRRTQSTVGGTERHFLYDRTWRILEERPGGETATPDRLYTWGLRHRTDMVCRDADLPAPDGTGSDSGSESSDSTSTSLQRHYVAYDWISPTALLDPATGDPVERYSYSAFGQRKVMDAGYVERSGSEYAWNFAFHGQFEDAETGWMNYGFRYFNQFSGRFINKDILQSDINRFSMALNCTPLFYDAYGLYARSGHYYTTYLVMRNAGLDRDRAQRLATGSQIPDMVKDYTAMGGSAGGLINTIAKALAGDDNLRRSQALLHALHGLGEEGIKCYRCCIRDQLKELLKNKANDWTSGLLIHALGDSYSHTYASGTPRSLPMDYDPSKQSAQAYGDPTLAPKAVVDASKCQGHAMAGVRPDVIGNRPGLYQSYVQDLSSTAGEAAEVPPTIKSILPNLKQGASHDQEAAVFGLASVAQGALPAGILEGKYRDIEASSLHDLGINPDEVAAAYKQAMGILGKCLEKCTKQ